MAEKEYIEREALKRAIARNCHNFETLKDAQYAGLIVHLAPAADVKEKRYGAWAVTYGDCGAKTDGKGEDERSQTRDDIIMLLLEDVLDTLVEVGNGVTDEQLHEAADKLFKVRDIMQNKG